MLVFGPRTVATIVTALLLAALAIAAGIPIRYNVRNLMVRWPATLMTAGAFTMVISLLVVMLAFVNGMARLTAASGHEENVIILSEGATDEAFSTLGYADISDIENDPRVLRDGDKPLCSRETFFVISQPIADPPPGRPKKRFLQLRGVEDPLVSARVHQISLHSGGAWFSVAGVRQLPGAPADAAPAIEVVLGSGIAGELGRDRNAAKMKTAKNPHRLDVGEMFELGERQWLVVGVMESSGSTFDSEVWAKRAILGPKFGKETYTSLVLRTADEATAREVKTFFNDEYKKAPVQALVETEYFTSLSQTNQQFLVGVVFISVVMGIGGVFGVMNTMFAAISQRSKDIGVLRLLGYGRWEIAGSFVLESLVLAIVGGLIGCAVGLLVDGWTANSIVSSGQGGGKFVVLKLVVDWQILTSAMMLSLAMGAIGGLVPALNTMRLRPLETLR